MYTLVNKAATAHRYDVFVVKANGSFVRKQLLISETKLRLLQDLLCEFQGKVHSLAKTQEIVDSINEARTNNKFTGQFEIVPDTNQHGSFFRVNFKEAA